MLAACIISPSIKVNSFRTLRVDLLKVALQTDQKKKVSVLCVSHSGRCCFLREVIILL